MHVNINRCTALGSYLFFNSAFISVASVRWLMQLNGIQPLFIFVIQTCAFCCDMLKMSPIKKIYSSFKTFVSTYNKCGGNLKNQHVFWEWNGMDKGRPGCTVKVALSTNDKRQCMDIHVLIDLLLFALVC